MPPTLTRLPAGTFAAATAARCSVRAFTLSETRYAPFLALPRHAHATRYLSFVIAGAYVERVGSREWECRHNTLRYHPEGEEHADVFARSGARCLNIELARAWVEHTSAGMVEAPMATDAQSHIALQLRGLLRSGEAPDGLAIEELVLLLLDACAGEHRLKVVAGRLPWLSRVVAFLEESLDARVTLSDVAAVAQLHPTHLARAFRARTGRTIGEHVRRRRVIRAQQVLRAQPSYSISEVAHRTGFADHAHLTRTFTAIVGMGPRQYRALG